MTSETDYDRGYASIDANRRADAMGTGAGAAMWGPATVKLHLGWLAAQLKCNPRDQFRWGRYDALCDLLAAADGSSAHALDHSVLSALQGVWWKQS